MLEISSLLEAVGESVFRVSSLTWPVIINCSTNESSTETMIAASIVSPEVRCVAMSDVSQWTHSRKMMKKIGTEKRSFAILNKDHA